MTMSVKIVGTKAVARYRTRGGRVIVGAVELEPVARAVCRNCPEEFTRHVLAQLGYRHVGFLSKLARSAKRAVSSAARAVSNIAKKVARSKVVRSISKVARSPIVHQALQALGPKGQAISTGIRTAEATYNLIDKAKKSPAARAALDVVKAANDVRKAPRSPMAQKLFSAAARLARRRGIDPRPYAHWERTVQDRVFEQRARMASAATGRPMLSPWQIGAVPKVYGARRRRGRTVIVGCPSGRSYSVTV